MDDDFGFFVVVIVLAVVILLIVATTGYVNGKEYVCVEEIPAILEYEETTWLENTCYGVDEDGSLHFLFE